MAAKLQNLGPIILLAAILAAGGWWVFWAYFDTYHLETVKAGVLYRDGVRGLHQFDLAVRKTHVRTVVSLVDDHEINQQPFTDEMAYCRAHGIEVIRIPVQLGGWPAGDQISRFLTVAGDPARQPVLVHCAQGVRRTGMMVAAYQLSVLKLDREQALAAIKSFGHSRRTVNDVEKFIAVYDPKTQRMTADMPVSEE